MSKGTKARNTKSVSQAINNLNKFLRSLETVPAQEVKKSAVVIQANAVAEAPYREGTLERSIKVKSSTSGGLYHIEATASAESAKGYDYAGIQHENRNFEHPIKGKAFYIRDPFVKEVNNLKRRIRRRLKLKHGS